MRQSFLLVILLIIALGACNGDGSQVETAAPVAVASARPSDTATAPAVPPSPTPTQIPPTARATSLPPTATFTVPLPSDTPTPLRPTETPTPAPLTPTPTPTETPKPTATTPSIVDPATIRVDLQKIVGGLQTPVGVANAGDGSGRLFVLEKVGRVRVVHNGVLFPAPFLEVTDRVGSSQNEQGLLGLVFHPDYLDNGLFFVNYTDRQGDTVISRFSVSANPTQADPGSEDVLLTIDQPAGNHNGGHLAFGPDGYLYVGTGDGGASGDAFGNGQNGATLLGAMLRLDVDRGQPYAIPPDNPFIANPNVRNEIWAIGLRNPWRYAFDRLTGDLYIADVGQNMYEEINFQPSGSAGGQNYGWPIMEGLHCFPADQPCDRAGLTLPVREYDHTQGCSVTGGSVYRGREFPLLSGIYVFGDYCSGRIWGLAFTGGGEWRVARLAQADMRISAFGEDEAGELYLLDMGRGELHKIIARSR
ncbi:MAG: PQQ-dependent sugar dehydrogenase [Anaerolineae bacterium]